MAEVTLLKRKRGTFKRAVTLFNNLINQVEAEIKTSDRHEPTKVQYRQISDKCSHLKSLGQRFEDVQLQIEETSEEDALQVDERETWDNSFYTAVDRGEQFLERFARVMTLASADGQPSNNPPRAGGQLTQGFSGIKMPTIELKKFCGNLLHWLEFRDTYLSMIHNNSSLDEINKFHYLKTSLINEAQSVIQSLEITAANYPIAWQSLLDRYDNKSRLINSHLRAVFALKRLDREDSIGLRRLGDDMAKHLRALKSLGIETDQWDPIIIFMINERLDDTTAREWEGYKLEKKETLELIREFLRHRANVIEQLETSRNNIRSSTAGSTGAYRKPQVSKSFAVINKNVCAMCKGDHRLFNCTEFAKLLVPERIARVKQLNLCHNCLGVGHFIKNCKSAHRCKKCNAQHNSLLHIERTGNVNANGSNAEGSNASATISNSVNYFSSNQSEYVLLSTAVINVGGLDKKLHTARVLLDSCSQSCFMTKEFCNKLQLKTHPFSMNISSLNNVTHKVNEVCKVAIRSRYSSYAAEISCLVVPEISDRLPNFKLDVSLLDFPANVKLADPQFNHPNNIDMLIGASHFFELLCQGQIKLGKNQPVLQKTKLGWVISGSIAVNKQGISQSLPQCHFYSESSVSEDNISQQLKSFWEIEECRELTTDGHDNASEVSFNKSTYRDASGRFVVRFPFKADPLSLGNSRESAVKRFLSLEKRLNAQPFLKDLYCNFMAEYESLGHMSWVGADDCGDGYYLPHHGVYKEDNKTTKLRVVFDASAKTTNNLSLNQIQHVGPVIQDDLFSILIRFRQHNIVISADIQKMYRQVLINPSERKFQKIIWRSKADLPLATYQLNTVTYGTAAASFLAIRSLFQLAHEIEGSDPLIANIIKGDFYVDDLLSGAETVEEAMVIGGKITEVLNKGCFTLHKWLSNNKTVTDKFASGHLADSLNLSHEPSVKTLGLIWAHQADVLKYQVNSVLGNNEKITKRSVLSNIAKIFDPLGLLAPVLTDAKLIIQQLWAEGVSWDESLSLSIVTSFQNLKKELEELSKLEIPRRAFLSGPASLHVFCDASERAYGACAYIVSKNNQGNRSLLLCGKGKVAPLKRITIPKLELMGALLASRLLTKIRDSLNTKFDQITLWTDSTVVLGWLRTEPTDLKIFVSNRVAEIQNSTKGLSWKHVSSQDNPADLISRGSKAKALMNSKIWWYGPQWLVEPLKNWPESRVETTMLPEMRKTKNVINQVMINQDNLVVYENYSSYSKLKRVLAYCIRFINNCKKGKANLVPGNKLIHISELKQSEILLAKLIQRDCIPSDMEKVKQKFATLSPFLHSDGLIRVGGRLKNAPLKFETKHPILIDGKHYLSKLLFQELHSKFFHVGPQALLSLVRQTFWCTGGRNLAKKIVKKCIICFKASPKPNLPKMGDLPFDRVNPSRPFTNTGIDYAGPFLIRDRKGRGYKTSKAYICIFICFAVKAIHVELISDLTSENFIMALRRFSSRRGCPQKIFSDNGLNFVGANNELKDLQSFLIKNESELATEACKLAIDWQFIPPYSPHMGGLWEAAVKRVKYHLKRVAANVLLTYEEMYSLLVQIEAIINSRPLCPMSTDPNDLTPLTPAHFLIGEPLTSVPDPEVIDIPSNRLSRFQLVQKIQQDFWLRWKREYLGELQRRTKWQSASPNLKINDLVLIIEDNRTPLQWKMGRVAETHPGADHQVRVVTLKTSGGLTKRSVTKLCPLPMEEDVQAK